MIDQDLKNRLQVKLEQIANILYDSTDKFNNPGVLSGVSGLSLFMFYYSRFTGNDKFAEVGRQALGKAVTMINDGFANHSFCSGISGLAWTFEHLARNGFVEKDQISFLNDLYTYLFSCMEADFSNRHYDFLYGGIRFGRKGFE